MAIAEYSRTLHKDAAASRAIEVERNGHRNGRRRAHEEVTADRSIEPTYRVRHGTLVQLGITPPSLQPGTSLLFSTDGKPLVFYGEEPPSGRQIKNQSLIVSAQSDERGGIENPSNQIRPQDLPLAMEIGAIVRRLDQGNGSLSPKERDRLYHQMVSLSSVLLSSPTWPQSTRRLTIARR